MSRILVVDDEKIIRETLGEILSYENYIVDFAWNGKKCLELARKNEYSLILLDIKMPVMGGVDTLRVLKVKYPFVPVIMISGHADILTAVNCVKLGAYHFFEKPPDLHSLLTTVRNAIDQGVLLINLNSLKKENTSGLKTDELKIPNDHKTSIHQYLIYFSDYVFKSKGEIIDFSVNQTEEGIKLHLNPKSVSVSKIKEWLVEYLDFIRLEKSVFTIKVENSISDNDYLFLIEELKNQVLFYKSSIEILKKKSEFLKKENAFLKKLALSNNSLKESTNSNKQEIRNTLKEKVAKGHSLNVLKELSERATIIENDTFKNKLALLRARLNDLIMERGAVLLGNEEFRKEKSQIESAILSIIDQYPFH